MAMALDQSQARYHSQGCGNAERRQDRDAFQWVRLQPGDGKIDHMTSLLHEE